MVNLHVAHLHVAVNYLLWVYMYKLFVTNDLTRNGSINVILNIRGEIDIVMCKQYHFPIDMFIMIDYQYLHLGGEEG